VGASAVEGQPRGLPLLGQLRLAKPLRLASVTSITPAAEAARPAYFIVGMTKSDPLRGAVGQRDVTVFSRV
jgi:hypothetical protein